MFLAQPFSPDSPRPLAHCHLWQESGSLRCRDLQHRELLETGTCKTPLWPDFPGIAIPRDLRIHDVEAVQVAGLPRDTASFVPFWVTSQAGRKTGRLLIGPAPLAAKSYIGHHAVVCSGVLFYFDQKFYFETWKPFQKELHLNIEVSTKFSSFNELALCSNSYPISFCPIPTMGCCMTISYSSP